MTWERFFTVLQFALLVVGGILVSSLRQAFRAGGDVRDFENRLRSTENRMDQAGEKMSEFATQLQGFPERMRDTYATIRQHEDLKQEVFYLREKVDRRDPGAPPDTPWPNNRRKR